MTDKLTGRYGMYNIITGDNKNELIQKVNNAMEEDWMPVGPPVFEDVWYQGMINTTLKEKQEKIDIRVAANQKARAPKKKAPVKEATEAMEQPKKPRGRPRKKKAVCPTSNADSQGS